MLELANQKKTIGNRRVTFTQDLEQLKKTGLDLKKYKKISPKIVFLYEGLLCSNGDFSRMKFYKHIKLDSYCIIQGNIFIPLDVINKV